MTPKVAEPKPRAAWSAREWGIVAGLIALVAAVFAQVRTHEFLNWDDPRFVFLNPLVRNFDVAGAFTSTQNTWAPLTWLSYMLDAKLFGMRAAAFLIVNVLLHAASACLLFAALRLMTRATWPSAFVAALFAIHPMHVESVAWIAERKDVLSTFFAMLALLFYARRKLVATAVAMALSLMAKQTCVTLPFVLLLLDFWPLRRLNARAVIEKIPLFALTIAGSVVAVVGQKDIGGMRSAALVPMGDRLANALVAYGRYIGKMFVPMRMAAYYPFESLNPAAIVFCALMLIAITIAAFAMRRAAPWFLTGWLWFAGTLVPVIGIVQIGNQAIADRYTYFAYIGLFIAVTWAAMALKLPQNALAAAAIGVVVVLAGIAWRQTGVWQNCDTLFSHTIAVTPPNPIAEYSLGQYLQLTEPERALEHLRRAIDIESAASPDMHVAGYGWFVEAHVAASTALLVEGREMPPGPARDAKLNESMSMARGALQLDPAIGQAGNNIVLAQRMLAPPSAPRVDDYLNRGTTLSNEGKFDDAVAEYRHAVDLAPKSAEARVYLALGLVQAKRRADAVAQLAQAKAIDAKQANDILTHALRLQPAPDNLDHLITELGR